MGGLRRLEYRGYDSAGIAVIDDAGRLETRKRAGKLQVLVDELGGQTRSTTAAPASATPAGPRTAGPTDGNAHPHLGDDGKLALIHNGIIENFAALKQELLDAGESCSRARPTPRWPPSWSGVSTSVSATSARPSAPSSRASTGRSPSSPCTRTSRASSSAPAATPRSSSAWATARTSWARMSPPSSSTPAAPSRSARTRSSRSRRTPVTVTDFDGNAGRDRRVRHRLGRVGGRKGRLVELHGQGDQRGAGGRGEHASRPDHGRPRGRAGTGRIRRRRAGRHRPHRHHRLRHGRLRRECSASTRSRSGRGSRSTWSSRTSSATATRCSTDRTLVISISQSGETMDTLMAVKYAREAGAQALSICNTQGSTIPRESDAVLYTHAGPEVAVASTKAFVAQVTALYLFGLHLARVRGTLTAGRDRRERPASCRRIPDQDRQGARRRRGSASSPAG